VVTRDLAAVVLAAGEGRRLQPLTSYRPKPLCPVANVSLLDHALARITAVTPHVAVNAHHLGEQIERHLAGSPVHVSVEEPVALGTAGALGRLKPWIDGRHVLVVNGDTWHERGLVPFADGWTGERVRLLVAPEEQRPDFDGMWRYVGAALLPWRQVSALSETPSGLYEVMWRELAERREIEYVAAEGRCIPCDTPADYLAANLLANGGESSIGERADVRGAVVRSVVWPGGVVAEGETLVDAIRIGADVTVRPFA
jgi:MurNAc alpha-1-phosphate uridylyltransferase